MADHINIYVDHLTGLGSRGPHCGIINYRRLKNDTRNTMTLHHGPDISRNRLKQQRQLTLITTSRYRHDVFECFSCIQHVF